MTLRARIRAGEILVGAFQKTPSPQVTELLGLGGLDFVVADQEHAPIDIGALDLLAMAGRGVGLPVLIRATHCAGPAIWPALDLGCAGVMVPHVRSGDDARIAAGAMKYARGRGFSPSGRAGGYGTTPAQDYRAASDAGTVLLAQIEDAEALTGIEDIAAVPEVDVLFVGPQDLSLSLGCAANSAEMAGAIRTVTETARRHGKAAGLFVGHESHIAPHAATGVTVFVCGSDQGLLLGGARRLVAAARHS